MEILINILKLISIILSILTGLVVLIKPLREKLLGNAKIKAAEKCILRRDMLHTYYKNLEQRKLRQYEYENFVYEYQAYKALGGNSFIDKIHAEVKEWDIVP